MGIQQFYRFHPEEIVYRKHWYIHPSSAILAPDYFYHHEDWDGHEDPRCGYAHTIREAKDDINIRFDEDMYELPDAVDEDLSAIMAVLGVAAAAILVMGIGVYFFY